jgi:hypothetical protein
MAKDFPTDSDYAYQPPAPDNGPLQVVRKIVPGRPGHPWPASQSDRPQLRPIMPLED